MNLRRRYSNPPIIEALCEFHFKPGLDWNLTMPGKLHTELGDDYTGKPRHQKSVELGVQFHEGSPRNVQLGEGPNRVQLVTENEKRIVGIGPNVLSVHMLRPYQDTRLHAEKSGWDEFQLRIVKALETYWKVAKPEGVKRIGVRYIN